MVGLSGVVPLFVISNEMGLRLRSDGDTGNFVFRVLLVNSFQEQLKRVLA